jgi:hypothetical protein
MAGMAKLEDLPPLLYSLVEEVHPRGDALCLRFLRCSSTSFGDKLVPWNLELIFSHLCRMTVYNISLYIYLYLEVININQTSKIRLVCTFLDKLLESRENGS